MWGGAVVARQAHNLKVRGSNPFPATLNKLIMEKRMDALKAPTLVSLIEYMNRESITKEDVVQIFCTNNGEFIAVLYK